MSSMMRTVISCFFLACSFTAVAQEKNDVIVIVEAKDTANLFNRVVRSLYENGYSIEEKDQQAGFIETGWMQLNRTAGKVKTRLLFSDSTIQFSSKYKLAFKSAFGEMETDIKNTGSKGSDMKIYWNELVRLARLFGEKLRFSK